METMQEQLKKVKCNFEVDYELKIKELERENAYLVIQNNKFRQEISKLAQKPFFTKNTKSISRQPALAEMFEKLKRKHKRLQKYTEELKTKLSEKNRKIAYSETLRDFFEKRVKEIYGHGAYFEIMYHADCPDKDTLKRLREYKGDYKKMMEAQ